MDVAQIEERIKSIVSEATSIDPAHIGSNTSFIADLDLDSLTMLEIAVDIDHAFGLKLLEEQMNQIQTLQDAVNTVLQQLEQTPG